MNDSGSDEPRENLTRRQFLDQAGAVAGVSLLSTLPMQQAAAQAPSPASADANYPPAWQGMRGQNDAAFRVAHAMRDGASFGQGNDTGEFYDLVVVGAGVSGLAAAYYFRKAVPDAKILILDNCDDFGGHARRNEFLVNGRPLIGFGGAETIVAPASFTPEGRTLLSDIGVDVERYRSIITKQQATAPDRGFSTGAFFDKDGFGADRLVPHYPESTFQGQDDPELAQKWAEFLKRTPLSPGAKDGLLRLATETRDYLPGLSSAEKADRLKKMSYRDYLVDIVKVHLDTVEFLQYEASPVFNSSGGADSFSAWLAYQVNMGGFRGLGLPPIASSMYQDIVHFPDGNATVARLLVRWLIPSALPGNNMEDALARRVDYGKLDRPESAIRIRLSSTVVRARHLGDPADAKDVEISYVQGGQMHRVRGSTCVLACFNAIIPYLCPEIPDAQKEALHMAVRKPLMVVSVALQNWRAFAKLRVNRVISPGSYFQLALLEPGLNMGDYTATSSPGDPVVFTLIATPGSPGMPPRDQFRLARAEMLTMDLDHIREMALGQLDRMLAGTGFDARRDVLGVMVNRWGHGYASGANALYDPDWANEDVPWVKGRQRFARIAIANSDASGIALMQTAFDQADRSVKELVQNVIRPPFSPIFPERG